MKKLKIRLGIVPLTALFTLATSVACETAVSDDEALDESTPSIEAEYTDALHDLKRSGASGEEYAQALDDLNAQFGLDPSAAADSQGLEIGVAKQALTTAEATTQVTASWVAKGQNVRTFRPGASGPVTVSTSNLSAGADPMLAVIRWESSAVQQVGSTYPSFSAQAPFTVVAFNDDAFDWPNRASSVTFQPDGTSAYTAVVMPFSASSQGTANLVISGCPVGCSATVPVAVQGTILKQVLGNTVEIPTGGNDPWLFAFKLNPSTLPQKTGTGVSNDDGLPGAMPRIRLPGFSLDGAPETFVFVTGWSAAGSATLLAGNEARANPNCVAPSPGNLPVNLAATGCFKTVIVNGIPELEKDVNGAFTEALGANVMPYSVAHGFWSDGVVKERYLALPTDGKITKNSTTGKWELPNGAVTIKNFRYNNKLFETRFFVRSGTSYFGYTYRWDDDGQQRLVPDAAGQTKDLNGDAQLGFMPWTYPTRSECSQCHNASAGYFLGLSTRQFNIDVDFPQGVRTNQIQGLHAEGYLDLPGASTPQTLEPAYEPRPTGAANEVFTAEQARAYIDVNCAYCHNATLSFAWQPGFDVPYASLNAGPGRGFPTAIDPGHGDAEHSGIIDRASRRVTVSNSRSMPPLATNRVDTAGVNLMTWWINHGLSTTGGPGPEGSLTLATTGQCTATTGANQVSLQVCQQNVAAQRFHMVDVGKGMIKIQPTATATSCLAPPVDAPYISLIPTALEVRACAAVPSASETWYRDYQTGGRFLVRNASDLGACLAYDSTTGLVAIRSCNTVTPMGSQLWANAL